MPRNMHVIDLIPIRLKVFGEMEVRATLLFSVNLVDGSTYRLRRLTLWYPES